MSARISIYENEWVALTPKEDRVVGHNVDLVKLVDEVKKANEKNVIYTKVLSTTESIAPTQIA